MTPSEKLEKLETLRAKIMEHLKLLTDEAEKVIQK